MPDEVDDLGPECPDCPQCPDCPECPECEEPTGIPQAVLRLVRDLVMASPHTAAEAIWRAFAVLGLSGLMLCGWIGWRYPQVVQQWLERTPSQLVSDRLQVNTWTQRQVMDAVASFIRVHKPQRFAIIGLRTSSSGEKIWATDDVRSWPANFDGVLTSDLVPAMGPLMFGECWDGTLDGSPGWSICPIGNGTHWHGLLVSQWPKGVSLQGRQGLKYLADRVQGLLY